ncbi:MAG: hypothetical protein WCC66_10125 [Rhizobiaceae bacterium]
MKQFIQVNAPRPAIKPDSFPMQQGAKVKPAKPEFSAILAGGFDTPVPTSALSKVREFDGNMEANPEVLKLAGKADLSGNHDEPSPHSGSAKVKEMHDTMMSNPEVLDAVEPVAPESALSANRLGNPSDRKGKLPSSEVDQLPLDLKTQLTDILVGMPCPQAVPFNEGLLGRQGQSTARDDTPNVAVSGIHYKSGNRLSPVSRSPETQVQQLLDLKSDAHFKQNVTSKAEARVSAKAEVPVNLPPISGDLAVANVPAFADFADLLDGGTTIQDAALPPGTFVSQIERHAFNLKTNTLRIQLESPIFGTVSAHFSDHGDQMSVVVSSTGSVGSENLSELESELKRWIDIFEPNIKPEASNTTPRQQEALEPGRDSRQGASPTYDFSRQRQAQQDRPHGKPQPDARPRQDAKSAADQPDDRWRTI